MTGDLDMEQNLFNARWRGAAHRRGKHQASSAFFGVKDIEASLCVLCGRLGFTITSRWGPGSADPLVLA